MMTEMMAEGLPLQDFGGMPDIVATKRAWSHSTIHSPVTLLEERFVYR
jgi:hypothetical protein